MESECFKHYLVKILDCFNSIFVIIKNKILYFFIYYLYKKWLVLKLF